jgi:hypothetical protein
MKKRQNLQAVTVLVLLFLGLCGCGESSDERKEESKPRGAKQLLWDMDSQKLGERSKK